MVAQKRPTLLVGARVPAVATSNMKRKSSERDGGSCCSHWAGAGCQKFGSVPGGGEVFFLDIPFYRTPLFCGQAAQKFGGVAPALRHRTCAVLFFHGDGNVGKRICGPRGNKETPYV